MKCLRTFVVAVSMSGLAFAVAAPGCAERPGTKKDEDKDKDKDGKKKKDEKKDEKKAEKE